MNKEFKLRDLLYYTDLIYEIKKIAGFCNVQDEIIEQRISERSKSIKSETKIFKNLYSLSDFQEELFEIVRGISKKANVSFRSIEEISKYPEYVCEVLEMLSKKNTENVLVNHLKLIIKEMGLEHEFSLSENAEQCVCLNKKNKMWEVYIVERGISFEKDVFEECYDACIQVLNHLADSKKSYEESKENFSLVRNLIK